MKLRHIVASLAISLPALMIAVPADPRPRAVTNPDGSSVAVRVHGDEYFHFMTDVDCTRILERDDRGFVVDAVRDGRLLMFSDSDVAILRKESPSLPRLEEAKASAAADAPASFIHKMGALDTEGRSNYPTVGKGNRSLVVLVEFADQKFIAEDPKDYFTRQLNQPGFSDYGGSGSALDYYMAASNGHYQPQFDVFGPVTLEHEASYYAGMGNSTMSSMIRQSLTALHDAGEIDFSNYDLDEDGIVDTVFFYYAGYGSADSETETIWPHQYDYRYLSSVGTLTLRFDDKKIGPYACANELKGWNPQTRREPWKDGSTPWIDGIGTFCHEYGHVLGLPDLYDVEYTEGVKVVTPGEWDVMDAGCYNFEGCVPPLMSAYEQWVCHWLEFTEAQDGEHYDLKALGHSDAPKAVRIAIPKAPDSDAIQPEYFIIEARDKSGWDACFPEAGLLIWRINYNKNTWVSNQVNSAYGSNVEIIYANGEKNPTFTSGSIYPGSPNELVPSKNYYCWKSPFITSLSYDQDSKTGSFDFNALTEPPSGAPVLHDNPYADASGARNFYLEWDALEGADSYRLTINRTSTGKPLGIYNEFNVGNVTSYKVVSVPVGYWNNEVEVYVRAVMGIPSSETSNVLKFIPAELSKGPGNAVDGVGEESVEIVGGVGCIIAPDGAEVFDMTGSTVSASSLAPGLYIVRYGSISRKVLVR